jgi:hypothetical protein
VSALRKILTGVATTLVVCVASASTPASAGDASRPENVSGRFWERIVDARHPEMPPRLVLTHDANASSAGQGSSPHPVVCVHAGEHLVLHQTGIRSSTLSLAATALENGVCGARVRVHIAVTGVIAEVTVTAPGTGTLERRGSKWR